MLALARKKVQVHWDEFVFPGGKPLPHHTNNKTNPYSSAITSHLCCKVIKNLTTELKN